METLKHRSIVLRDEFEQTRTKGKFTMHNYFQSQKMSFTEAATLLEQPNIAGQLGHHTSFDNRT